MPNLIWNQLIWLETEGSVEASQPFLGFHHSTETRPADSPVCRCLPQHGHRRAAFHFFSLWGGFASLSMRICLLGCWERTRLWLQKCSVGINRAHGRQTTAQAGQELTSHARVKCMAQRGAWTAFPCFSHSNAQSCSLSD